MPSPPFPPRPVPTVRYDNSASGAHSNSRSQTSAGSRPHLVYTEVVKPPQRIIRPPSQHTPTHNTTMLQQQQQHPQQHPRPQLPHSARTTPTSPYHHHTSSSPELRPRVDSAWSPRTRQPYNDLGQMNASSSTSGIATPSHHPNPSHPHTARSQVGTGGGGDPDPAAYLPRRSAFAARVNPPFVPTRGRSASEVRIPNTPPPDLERDRLARACGQSSATNPYPYDDRGRKESECRQGSNDSSSSSSRLRGELGMSGGSGVSGNGKPPMVSGLKPSVPKMKPGHMYRRLDALARRSGHRAMDYLGLEDVAGLNKIDFQLREQLKRKRSERMQDKDPNFHAIGASLEDVLLYASTSIVIGDYQHDLPIVVVACVEELTRTGIYQNGLFRALPSRDRHLQLIDLFDKSADYGSKFNMRGQTMPDICALLSTFLSSLPGPLLDPNIHAALWHWSVKPSVKREDERREKEEKEEEERRARGELPRQIFHPTDLESLRLDPTATTDVESDQIATAQLLLRFLPLDRLSLLIYLFAFFTQLPLCPENGLQFEDVARIFGWRLLGGSGGGAKQISQKVMVWLLTRWPRIWETLFSETCGFSPPGSPTSGPRPGPIVASESCSSDAGKVNEKRKGTGERRVENEGNGRDVGSGASSSGSRSDGEEESLGESDLKRRKKRDSVDGGGMSSGSGSGSSKDRDRERRSSHSARKDSRRGHRSSRRHHRHSSSSEFKDSPVEPQDPFSKAFANAANGNSLTAPAPTPTAHLRLPSPETKLLEARARISRLESDLRRNDARVVDVMKEKMVAEDEAMQLADRVEVLERMLREGVRESGDDERDRDVVGEEKGKGTGLGLKKQLRAVEKERDEAQRMMQEMRDLLGSRVVQLS